MKNFLLAFLLAFFAVSTAFGYQYTRDPVIKVTGYKMATKIPVTGSFKEVDFSFAPSKDFAKFLESTVVTINGMSIDTKMSIRDKSIQTTLFKLAKSPLIIGKIKEVSGTDKTGSLVLELTINNQKKNYQMGYINKNNVIKIRSKINILDFGMKQPFEAFAEKCKGFHGGKTWSEFDFEFEIGFSATL